MKETKSQTIKDCKLGHKTKFPFLFFGGKMVVTLPCFINQDLMKAC